MNDEHEISELLTRLASLCQNERKTKEIAKLLYKQHRTHQQSIGRFIQQSINVFSEMKDKNSFDLRNEETCKMSSVVNNQINDFSLPFI